MKLRISDTLSLPIEAITNTFAIFGIRGSGKSNLGAVMAEGIIEAGQCVCVIDPTGAWWGLKSSRDGKSAGLPVYVFGGEHADIPLEPTAGEVVANFVVQRRVPVVLDLRLMKKYEQIRFVVSFAETLFHRNREPLMVMIDEAARFGPQIIKDRSPDAARCLGAIEDLATLGRNRGIGVTLIAQRPAPVSTTLRTQCENLICLRTIGKHDRKALDEWVEAKGSQTERDEMMAHLAELPDGDGYFWSPAWLRIFMLTHFLQRATFDSGETPKIGHKPIVPRVFAEIDTAKLSQEIKATIERAKADDPRELRKQLAERDRRIEELLRQPAQVAVPLLKQEFDRGAESVKRALEKGLSAYEKQIRTNLRNAQNSLQAAAEDIATGLKAFDQESMPAPALPSLDGIIIDVLAQPAAFKERPSGLARTQRRESSPSSNGLPVGEQQILIACAQYPKGAMRDQLSILTGYKKSTRNAYLQRLRERGFIHDAGDTVTATREGIAALGSGYEPLPTGKALREYWLNRLPDGERNVLKVLLQCHGQTIDREVIDQMTNYKKSTRNAYLQRLQARRLVEVSAAGVSASKELF